MGMQSGAVRTFHVEGVFTTAATATVIWLMVYLTNWSGTVAKWSRLAGVLVSLFADALSGALLLGHAHIYASVLPFAISVAVVATAATAFGYRDEARE